MSDRERRDSKQLTRSFTYYPSSGQAAPCHHCHGSGLAEHHAFNQQRIVVSRSLDCEDHYRSNHHYHDYTRELTAKPGRLIVRLHRAGCNTEPWQQSQTIRIRIRRIEPEKPPCVPHTAPPVRLPIYDEVFTAPKIKKEDKPKKIKQPREKNRTDQEPKEPKIKTTETRPTFRVHTSNIRHAGTDAHVFIKLYGDQGKSEIIALEGKGDHFEAGQVDEIFHDPGTIGTPYKMRIWHDNRGTFPGWHLNKVEWVLNEHCCYVFACNRWLATDEEDGQIVRELPASGKDIKRPLPVLKYIVSVVTGRKFGSGTDANVFCCLNGERGDTGDRPLKKSSKHMNKFEAGNTDEFIIEAVDLMKIKSVRIGHDNAGGSSGWFLDKVMVRETSGKYGGEQVFPCNRWLATDEDDGQISRELFESKGSNENIKKSKKTHASDEDDEEILQKLFEHEEPVNKAAPDFRVHTSNIQHAGTDAHVFIELYGDQGKSEIIALEGKGDHFEAGQVDEIFHEPGTIGTPYKMRIWHDNKGRSPAWHLDKVEWMKDGINYVFPCGRWLAIGKDDNEIVRELPATGSTIRHPLPVTTGNMANATTDANVFCCLNGERGDTGDRQLKTSLSKSTGKFERGKTDDFIIEAVDLKKIRSVKIGQDNSGKTSAWYLEKVVVGELNGQNEHVFPCDCWLDADQDDGKIVRELFAV